MPQMVVQDHGEGHLMDVWIFRGSRERLEVIQYRQAGMFVLVIHYKA